MHLRAWRRVLLLAALLLAFGGSLGFARATLLAPRATPPTVTPIACTSRSPYRTDLIVIYPTATPPSIDTLSLNLPAPILVVPPSCP